MLSVRGPCDELITRPEESYRLRSVVVCDLETCRPPAKFVGSNPTEDLDMSVVSVVCCQLEVPATN